MKSLPFLFITLFSALSLSAEERPNVLLIYVDDLGYGDLAVQGHPVLQTPHLDRLAGEGLRLTRYYAPSALCSPSRASLMTGRMPYRTGVKSWIPEGSGIYLKENETTIAELLRDSGYATALIGKWHLNSDLGDASQPQPKDHGFDFSYGNNAFQIPTNHNPTNIFRNGEALPVQEGYTAQLYVDEAMSWLDSQAPEEKPFFLFLSMNEPHTTIENPAEFNALYSEYTDGEIIPIPSGEGVPKEKLIPRGPGEYYANITYMDFQLGRLLEDLERRGLAENTLVVFASDNGAVTSDWINWWEVNAYGSTGGYRGRKHFLYDGGLRVPAILKLPGVIESGESDEFVIGMDIFNTIAGLCGVEVPTDRPIDGIDISPLFQGGSLQRKVATLWALPTPEGKDFAYREGDWKLLLDSDGSPVELYDLKSDPLELFDLLDSQSEKGAELAEGFRSKLAEIQADPLLSEDS
ncbi:sulfatase-like hydrolase/transferase [Pelagicoccus albus]|uniref:Sulfatase-like hydrolase/transferase n=1 Tax=Pelagicoccus albus TaxID=415222 RepID=A0A7X1B848_9BACT|nr:sulfatase-like hydrolase/transferase [Pelagicoccus albus]